MKKFYIYISLFFWGGSLLAQTKDKTEVLNSIFQSIPSPLEISSLIKEVGIPYDVNILNLASEARKYTTDYQKALNLGIYSTDLGYVNIYQKKDTTAASYLGAITKLSDGLKIEKLIDFVAITQYAFANNINGLFAETSSSFEKISKYLIEEQKPELSVLILTGGWLETLHLTCVVAKNFPNKVLDERIAEQKIILDKLLTLLNAYKKGDEMNNLITDLNRLNDVFKKIKINQKTKIDENFKIEKWGNLEVVVYSGEQVNKNAPKYKPEDLTNILNVSSDIRTKMVN